MLIILNENNNIDTIITECNSLFVRLTITLALSIGIITLSIMTSIFKIVFHINKYLLPLNILIKI